MEVWVNIKEHPDYQISNHARIKSFKNNQEKILKGFIQNTGYLTVVLDNKKYLNSKGIPVNARNIRSVCEGKRKTAGGYYWKFAKSGE